jgi:hypothetical protein
MTLGPLASTKNASTYVSKHPESVAPSIRVQPGYGTAPSRTAPFRVVTLLWAWQRAIGSNSAGARP